MRKLLSALLLGSAMGAVAQEDYELRVLTFEDKDYKGGVNFAGATDWSSLIDDPQYGGPMLYGESGMGVSTYEEAYKWCDENNTWLFNCLSEGYGSWCYWSGGHAISNYGTANIEEHNFYPDQLTVYDPAGEDDVTRHGHGHNGSDNFAVQFGYADNSGFGLGEEALPFLEFHDGEARVIDHMWVNTTTYALSCYVNGNDLTASCGDDDWVKIVATGYDGDGQKTGEAEIYLCQGPENILMEWTRFDLHTLGQVARVTFNIKGSSDNGYGFSQPAYFAYDDVAVRFPKAVEVTESGYEATLSGVRDVVLRRAFKAGWNTVCLPFGTRPEDICPGARAQAFTSCDERGLNFTRVDKMEAGTPYLLYCPQAVPQGKTFRKATLAAGGPEAVTHGDFTFTGTYDAETDMAGKYGVARIDGRDKITKGAPGSTLKGTRAYFTTTGADVQSVNLNFADGEATGIEAAQDGARAATFDVYTLSGAQVRRAARTLDGLRPGTYIVNGKKRTVK